jgi:hypothetical protein
MAPAQGTKRLSDNDVKEIFSCLHEHGRRPPDHLSFRIIPVVSNTRRLLVQQMIGLLKANGSYSFLFVIIGTEWFKAISSVS